MADNKIKGMLDMLNVLKEQFLSLPEDMLLQINPNNNQSLEEGFDFIKSFNQNLEQFNLYGNKIEDLIKIYFNINPEEEDVEQTSINNSSKARVISELDSSKSHYLDEFYTYKRPYGFILDSIGYKGLKTWRSLYIQVLNFLREKDSQLFHELLNNKKFLSKRGNPTFTEKEDVLRSAAKLYDGFYVEVNLSANSLVKNIKLLLQHFDIDPKEMKIYLREDRDAI